MGKTIYVSKTNLEQKLKEMEGKRILKVTRNGKRYAGGQARIDLA